MHVFSALLDLIFPPRCPSCARYVEQRGFCSACAQRLIAVHTHVRTGDMACLCGIWSLTHYREGVRDLLRALKYQRQRSALPALRGLLTAGDGVLADLPRPLTAVAVPLSSAREQVRGFNQTAEIFAPWLQAHGIPLDRLLVRTRDTVPLYTLTRTERRMELRGAFAAADGADPAGRNILLVDDIMTTGATLIACAQALRRAGACNIYALVLASEHI